MCKKKGNMKELKGNYPCAEPQLRMQLWETLEPHGAPQRPSERPWRSHRDPTELPQRPMEFHRDPQSPHGDPTEIAQNTYRVPMEPHGAHTETHRARRSFEENISFSFKDISIILIMGGMCT